MIDPDKLKVLQVSALKLKMTHPSLQQTRFDETCENLKRFSRCFEMILKEPFLIDEKYKIDVESFMRALVLNNEMLIACDGNDVVGISILSAVRPGRSAELLGWVAPAYRRSADPDAPAIIQRLFQDELLDCAWNEFQLLRIEARIADPNRAAHRLVDRLGFRKVGDLRADFQSYGRIFDSVLYELLNPACDVQPIEERRNEQGRQHSSAGTEPERGLVRDATSDEPGDDAAE